MDREQELQRRISRLEERLANAEKELEDVLYAVSHDLRGPLRAIMSSSMIVIEDFGDQVGEEGQRELQRGSRAAKKIADIVEDILKMSRLNRQPMNAADVDLSALAEQVAAEAAVKAETTPSIEIQPGLKTKGDPQMLRMLLGNLIDNSIKFTPSGQAARIQIGQNDDGAFFVRDNGIGFETEQGARIFRPFERLNGDGTYPGSGMGLTTVRMLAQRHGGKTWAEGQPSQGATIWFTLDAE